jgi:hypothetical protein
MKHALIEFPSRAHRPDKVSPSKALVKAPAIELDIDESFLNRFAEEVRRTRLAARAGLCFGYATVESAISLFLNA